MTVTKGPLIEETLCIEVFPKDLTRRNHDDGRVAVSRALRAGYPVYRNDAPRL